MKSLFKIAILVIGMSCITTEADAQFGKRLLDRVKREAETKVEQKVNSKVRKTVDKTVDDVLEGPKNKDEVKNETIETVDVPVQPTETDAKVSKAMYDKLVADARRAINDNNYSYFEVKDRKAELNSVAIEAGITSTADIVTEINSFMASFNQSETTITPTNIVNKTNSTTSSSSPKSSGNNAAKPVNSSNNSSNNDPFAGKRPSNLSTSSGRVHDGKSTTFGEVSSNGEIKYKGSFVCKIDSKGVIYDRSNKVIGQVDRDGYIHKLTSSGRYDKIGRVDSNGNVYDGSSRVGQITSEIKDGSGKSLTNVLPHGVNKVHIGVMMFLNRRF